MAIAFDADAGRLMVILESGRSGILYEGPELTKGSFYPHIEMYHVNDAVTFLHSDLPDDTSLLKKF